MRAEGCSLLASPLPPLDCGGVGQKGREKGDPSPGGLGQEAWRAEVPGQASRDSPGTHLFSLVPPSLLLRGPCWPEPRPLFSHLCNGSGGVDVGLGRWAGESAQRPWTGAEFLEWVKHLCQETCASTLTHAFQPLGLPGLRPCSLNRWSPFPLCFPRAQTVCPAQSNS